MWLGDNNLSVNAKAFQALEIRGTYQKGVCFVFMPNDSDLTFLELVFVVERLAYLCVFAWCCRH